jgi:hypothetical protein
VRPGSGATKASSASKRSVHTLLERELTFQCRFWRFCPRTVILLASTHLGGKQANPPPLRHRRRCPYRYRPGRRNRLGLIRNRPRRRLQIKWESRGPVPMIRPSCSSLTSKWTRSVLHATVVDDRRRRAAHLDRGAFSVYEDGVPQTMTAFRLEDVPVAMGIESTIPVYARPTRQSESRSTEPDSRQQSTRRDLRGELQPDSLVGPRLHRQT